MSKPALGRGLGALLGGSPPATTPPPAPPHPEAAGESPWRRVPVALIQPCAFQPRKDFSEESLRELSDSIREQGIVQPLIVRARGAKFELIAGERRWRAAQMAGLTEVPVVVREADDRAALEMALIENLQRENLNPIEEALGYAQLIALFELKQEEAARRVGRSRAVVANALRLLKLPPEVQSQVRQGAISVGHAKALLGIDSEPEQSRAAARVVKEALNVRQTEDLVLQWRAAASPPAGQKAAAPPPSRDPHVADLETRLRERFGAKVRLKYHQGKGSIEIAFFSDDDLDRLLAVAGVGVE